jgi:mono/diheme cytochrome c family protein
VLGLALVGLVFVSACRQDMQDQPKYIPLRGSKFFTNGSSARPLVEHTVPRGFLRENKALYTGRKDGATDPNVLYGDVVTEMPLPVDESLINRGQNRFQIFCMVCHGMLGKGDGMVVRRGYKAPPSYHSEQLRNAPVGHFFDVMSNGWGVMPSYAAQITVQDRWAIVAYIRALQLSQMSMPADPPPGGTAPTASPSPGASPTASPVGSPAASPVVPAKPATSPRNGAH